MKTKLSKFDITEALAGNITRLQAIGELLDWVEGSQGTLPKGTTLIIDDVVKKLNDIEFQLKRRDHTMDSSRYEPE